MFKHFQEMIVKNTKIPRDVNNSLKTFGDTSLGFVFLFFGGDSYKKQKIGMVGQNLKNVRSSRKLRYGKIVFVNDDSLIFLVCV